MTENKFCQVCGHEYKDGANIVTIMEHIKEKHMEKKKGSPGNPSKEKRTSKFIPLKYDKKTDMFIRPDGTKVRIRVVD